MTINLQSLAYDMAHIVSDLPIAVVWHGASFNAVVSDISTGVDVDVPGYTATATLTVDYVLSTVNGTISENDIVTIGGNDYRVSRVSILPDGVTGHFECIGGQE